MKHVWSWFAALSIGLTVSCAPGSQPTLPPDPMKAPDSIEQNQEALTNAATSTDNPIYVAIYHFKRAGTCTHQPGDQFSTDYSTSNLWWPRPCSGRVIRKEGNVFFILTARHCVTTNGAVMGDLSDAADLRVTTALAPGVMPTTEWDGGISVAGTPPTTTTAALYAAGANNGQTGDDLAIIVAMGLNVTSGRTAIFAGTSTDLMGTRLYSNGYGRSVAGHCYGHNASGAGVLRQGYGFEVNNVFSNSFDHTFDSIFVAGQHQLGGDSGSPLHYQNEFNGTRWLVGVTSTQSSAAGGVTIRQWLQDKLGHLYLTNAANYRNSTSVVGALLQQGGAISSTFTGDLINTRLVYDQTKKQLNFSGFCVTDVGVGFLESRTCNDADQTQKWNYDYPTAKFTNVSTGRCAAAGTPMTSTTCQNTTAQSFYFLTDDEQLASGL